MRNATRTKVGDTVTITLTRDRQSRDLPIPTALHQALNQNFRAKRAWDAWTPSRRKEVLAYLNYLKSPAAQERTVAKVMRQLRKRSVGRS